MRRFVRVCCALCACLLALWPEGAAADEPILHEFLPSVDPDEVRALERPSAPDADEARAEQARRGDDAADDDGPGGGADEAGDDADQPVSRPRSAAPNPENFRPDRLTSLEGSLDYYETFNPSVAPFKRVTAFSAVRLDADGRTPVLGLEDTRRRSVPVEGEQAPAPDARPRDRFVGELELDFRTNPVQPLPTVSPESRILTLSTQPKVDLLLERDSADNMFVRARGPIPDGTVRVRWDTDAPRAYFGTDIPTTKLRDMRDMPKLPRLERSIARRALHFAAQLGITPNSDLRSALEKLTQHFRSFVESAEPPANTGDLYLDLVQGGKGLCRHRAYGFVVTARALKIEARFVQNEAHSWVEVRLPDTGFMRIDLGGASHGLTAHDTHGRSAYVPSQPDTLPRPAAYRQSHARAARDNPAPSEPQPAASEVASLAGRWLPDSPDASSQTSSARESSPGPGAAPRSGVDEPATAKQAVHLLLEDRRISAVRGGKLVLTGRALDDNERGVPGLRVEVWIRRPERQQRMLLAVHVSDADGYFRADFGVPPDLAVGDYRLLVRSDGDADHLPALSGSYD